MVGVSYFKQCYVIVFKFRQIILVVNNLRHVNCVVAVCRWLGHTVLDFECCEVPKKVYNMEKFKLENGLHYRVYILCSSVNKRKNEEWEWGSEIDVCKYGCQ